MILGKAARITVAARRDEMSEALVERLQGRTRDTQVDTCGMDDELRGVVADADLIVNATPVGMGPDDVSLVPAEWMHEGQVVADMIYRPSETVLLRAAREAGATPVGGLGMLVAQGAIAIEIWSTGATITAPRDIMRAAAEAELASMPRVGQGG
jgi:shikimate dehydrogenase